MYLSHQQIIKLTITILWGCSLSLGVNKLFTISANAVTAPSGKVSFEKSPRLIDAYTTFSGVRVRGATYYFDIELPKNAGEPLEQIVIAQRQGQEKIKFKPDKTVAYVGTHSDKQEQLNISTVTQNQNKPEITITFNDPISPGTTFTVGIKPKKNPFYGGIYLFGVTAFPRSTNSNGLYLGVGRFHFYRSGDHWGF